jgi:hypothetical protein
MAARVQAASDARLRRFSAGAAALAILVASAGCGERGGDTQAHAVEALPAPAGPGSGESQLAVGPDGRVVLSWVEPNGAGHALRYAVLEGEGWSAATDVARGEDWFVNWADFPSVVPMAGDLWAAHWLVRRGGHGYAYDVAISLSRDGGRSWSPHSNPHSDGTPTEHGFATLFPWRGGVGAVWLDGRNMLPPEDAGAAGHDHGEGGMTLRFALLDPAGTLRDEALLDGLTCDCCQTDVALAEAGPVVVYRDRSPDEIRDIQALRQTAAGWSAPVPVARDGWHIEGCPVNGPAAAARGSQVVVAWFTGAEGRPRVRFARSGDGAQSFGPPSDVDARAPLGRVDVALLEGGDAVVSWLAEDADGAAVALRRVRRDGTMGPVRIVGRTAASRPAGFPRLAASGNWLVVAWTEVRGESSRVATARVPVAGV